MNPISKQKKRKKIGKIIKAMFCFSWLLFLMGAVSAENYQILEYNNLTLEDIIPGDEEGEVYVYKNTNGDIWYVRHIEKDKFPGLPDGLEEISSVVAAAIYNHLCPNHKTDVRFLIETKQNGEKRLVGSALKEKAFIPFWDSKIRSDRIIRNPNNLEKNYAIWLYLGFSTESLDYSFFGLDLTGQEVVRIDYHNAFTRNIDDYDSDEYCNSNIFSIGDILEQHKNLLNDSIGSTQFSAIFHNIEEFFQRNNWSEKIGKEIMILLERLKTQNTCTKEEINIITSYLINNEKEKNACLIIIRERERN